MITIDPSLHNNTTPLYDDQFVLVNRTSTILTGLYRGTDEIEDPIKTDLRNSIIVEIEGYIYVNYVKVIEDKKYGSYITGKYGLFTAK